MKFKTIFTLSLVSFLNFLPSFECIGHDIIPLNPLNPLNPLIPLNNIRRYYNLLPCCWSPTSYFIGQWTPIFHSMEKKKNKNDNKKEEGRHIRDMVITIHENETLEVDYKGSKIKAKWKLYPHIQRSQRHYHRFMVHEIRFMKPPYLAFWTEFAPQIKWARFLQKFGIHVDFPIIPLRSILPPLTTMTTMNESLDDTWILEEWEDKGQIKIRGGWSCKNLEGKVDFISVR